MAGSYLSKGQTEAVAVKTFGESETRLDLQTDDRAGLLNLGGLGLILSGPVNKRNNC